ncbi:MAG: RNA polymerase sigma factor [Ruminococcaceae bacterium]|nr:RNA polymerase sigma factor [Oscillospiraceae bacterium]
MKSDRIESYIEKVYGYAVNHTYSREEADELSQEILFTAVRELPKLRDDSRFEPWLWGIANNVTKSFRRYMGKRRAMYSYDVPDYLYTEADIYDDTEEIYDRLRSKVAMLSAIYRDIIILYYYDSLSTKQISEKLGIPEGTVTWRLSEARRKLKKECSEMNATALKPVKMKIGIYGNGDYNGKTKPFPTVYINDALSQNILYYCYEEAKTIEELAKLCGVPAYYVEERMDNLLNREAVIEASKGKYQTTFILWSDKHGIYYEENAEKLLMPMMDQLLKALDDIAKEAADIDFYKAEKCEKDLYYLYAVMAFSYASEHYCKLPYPMFERKYDGNEWNYIGSVETGAHKRFGIETQKNMNLECRGTYNHTVWNNLNGCAYRDIMYSNYINTCEDILNNGSSENIDSVANAIKDGYIIKKEDGSFFVNTPAFTRAQKERFDAIAEKHLAPLMPDYSEAIDRLITGYKKLFPKHLNDDVDRMCQSLFLDICAVVIEYAQRVEKITMPSEECYCDAMIQFK